MLQRITNAKKKKKLSLLPGYVSLLLSPLFSGKCCLNMYLLMPCPIIKNVIIYSNMNTSSYNVKEKAVGGAKKKAREVRMRSTLSEARRPCSADVDHGCTDACIAGPGEEHIRATQAAGQRTRAGLTTVWENQVMQSQVNLATWYTQRVVMHKQNVVFVYATCMCIVSLLCTLARAIYGRDGLF